MAEIDRRTIQDLGLDGQVLMETAGRAVARWLYHQTSGTPSINPPGRLPATPYGSLPGTPDINPPGSPIAFLCGPGNNGGDGLVAARAWSDLGGQAQVFCLTEDLKGDAGLNLERARRWQLPIRPLSEAPESWDGYAWVVDALFGTGLTRQLSPQLSSLVNSLPPQRTLAIDIPSGIHSASGQVLGTAVRAHTTLTFGLPKLGQLLQPGASYCGQLVIEEIGFPRRFLQSEEWPGDWLTPPMAARLVPSRPPMAHKRSLGKLLIIAGSSRYPGAACLATLGALRAGAGLVYTCTPAAAAARLPLEAIPIPMQGDALSSADLAQLLPLLSQVDALCIGPGMGRAEETRATLHQILEKAPLPAVLDADALAQLPATLSPRILLTPHHGELAHMLHAKVADIEKDRLNHAIRAARNFNCTVLLKGDPTLVSTAGGRFLLSNQGTPVLAQGGTGDVLSGICGALLAQGLDSLDAGGLGAYLHGLAGRLSGVPAGLGAEALAGWLPAALAELTRSTQPTQHPSHPAPAP